MYKCEKCGEEFETPGLSKEIHSECPEQPFEIFCFCPFCRSFRIERTDTND